MKDAAGNEWPDDAPRGWVIDVGVTLADLAAQFSTDPAAQARLNRCIDEIRDQAR